jgi:hypothetical protein
MGFLGKRFLEQVDRLVVAHQLRRALERAVPSNLVQRS